MYTYVQLDKRRNGDMVISRFFQIELLISVWNEIMHKMGVKKLVVVHASVIWLLWNCGWLDMQ